MGHPDRMDRAQKQAQQQWAATESRRFPLVGGLGVVGRCRDLTRHVLDDWYSLSGPSGSVLKADILLLVSEVVTNACLHGGTPVELGLDRAPGRLRVQVTDTSRVGPRPHLPHRAARSSGHGLYLLQQLSDGWGWLPRGTGKTVWFVVGVPDGASGAEEDRARG
ncbi:histidine kinase-like protein [Streptomyces sp. SLBN-118]|uniref:ATP-binding protein n=1 Tax=Streptomyces sp. SLBN-118 TaxID=2768454 RepID=UPI001175381C|nr:ATP-binding protein [Streptomyces sp. SLBN-118]TQK42897.1 histidine kinase-like protein [Streptomyces sp. SLBN-118]